MIVLGCVLPLPDGGRCASEVVLDEKCECGADPCSTFDGGCRASVCPSCWADEGEGR